MAFKTMFSSVKRSLSSRVQGLSSETVPWIVDLHSSSAFLKEAGEVPPKPRIPDRFSGKACLALSRATALRLSTSLMV